jgi:hypothetical protein
MDVFTQIKNGLRPNAFLKPDNTNVGGNIIYILRELINEEAGNTLFQLLSKHRCRGGFTFVEGKTRRLALSNEENLLATAYLLSSSVGQLTGIDLKPSYTYISIYPVGEALERHTDREECEVTLAIYLHDYLPPNKKKVLLCFGDLDDPVVIYGMTLDAIIFKGREVPHWRSASNIETGEITTILFHYVPI